MSYRGIDTNAIKWAFYSAAIAGEQLITKPKEESKTSEVLTSITISENTYIDSNNKPLPYAIKQIHISEIQIINNKVTFFTNDNDVNNPKAGVLFDQLASGPKSIFAMIGDMIIRFYDMQPEIIDPKDFSGIAIIDELDVHLHAKWQRQFPILLSQAFPNIQFIVSTHSGIPFQGVDKVRVVYLKVERNKETGIKISYLYKD